MNTNNLQPFDLETALKHPERVVTRDGRKVSEIYNLKVGLHRKPILCVIIGEPIFFHTNGLYQPFGHESTCHLFLLPQLTESWLTVYCPPQETIRLVHYESGQDAKHNINHNPGYINTIRITHKPL